MDIQIQPKPTPGFSSDGLSYSVAEDFPKIIAQISSEYEARAKNPRYNPFGPSPDSPEQLRKEGLKPWDELWSEMAMGGGARPSAAVAPKTFEIGNRLIQMDAAGKPVEIYAAPTVNKDEMTDLQKKALAARIMGLERDRSNPDAAREFKMQGTTVEKELQKSWDEAATLLAPKKAAAQVATVPPKNESFINGEQIPRQPQGVFRMGGAGEDWQYDPLQQKVGQAPDKEVQKPAASRYQVLKVEKGSSQK
jgi:hypothetical protein